MSGYQPVGSVMPKGYKNVSYDLPGKYIYTHLFSQVYTTCAGGVYILYTITGTVPFKLDDNIYHFNVSAACGLTSILPRKYLIILGNAVG